MYDQTTAELIQSTPALDGLNRHGLPEELCKAFAEIAAARLRLRTGDVRDEKSLAELVQWARRLAFTNEALVAVTPEREDRASAAFVSATAHQLCFNAEAKSVNRTRSAYLGPQSISSDISAMLL